MYILSYPICIWRNGRLHNLFTACAGLYRPLISYYGGRLGAGVDPHPIKSQNSPLIFKFSKYSYSL
jgi:hypothetical protein